MGFLFVNGQNEKFLRDMFSRISCKSLPLKYCFLKLSIHCTSSYVRHIPNCFVMTLNKQGCHYLRKTNFGWKKI